MKVPNIRELGELYPKTAILGITTLIVAGGVFILGTGVGFDFSRFFACDPAEGECPGGGFNSGEDISFEVTEETEVTGSTNQGGTNEEVAVAEETTTGGAPGEVVGSSTEDSCADGDCDGDGYLNPAVGGNDCNDEDPNLYPGNGCPGDTQSSTTSVATTEEAQTTETTTTTEEETTQSTTTVDPCADGDCDGDGYLNPVVGGNDCDDGNANVHPGAGCAGAVEQTTTSTTAAESTEANPSTNENPASTQSVDPCADGDCDGDGYLNPVVGGNDCDDGNANVHPGAGCADTVAQETAAAPSSTVVAAITNNPNPAPAVDPCADGDCDGDGYLNPVVQGGNDCDDSNPAVHPGAGCPGVQTVVTPAISASPITTALVSSSPSASTPISTPAQTLIPPLPACGELVGSRTGALCSEQPACPTGYTSAGISRDCSSCCLPSAQSSTSPLPSLSPSPSPAPNGALSCGALGGTECVPSGGACSTGNEPKTGSADCSGGGFTCCGPSRHLACVNNACVYAVGSGANECSGEGTSCGVQVTTTRETAPTPTGRDSVIQALASRGIQIQGAFSKEVLEEFVSAINWAGQKGNINRFVEDPSSPHWMAVSPDGVLHTRVETLEQLKGRNEEAFVHEIGHSVDFTSGGSVKSTMGTLCPKIDSPQKSVLFGNDDTNAKNMVGDCAKGDTGHAWTALFQGALRVGPEPLKAYASGKQDPKDQYNFVASKFGWSPLAFGMNANSSLALISELSEFSTPRSVRVLGAIGDDLNAFLYSDTTNNEHITEDKGPGVTIVSPTGSGAQSVSTVLVSGNAHRNTLTGEKVSSVEIKINGTVVTSVVPVEGMCSGQACYTWSSVLPLYIGSNTIQATSIDAQGVRSTVPSTIIVTYIKDLPLGAAAISSPVQQIGARVSTGPGEVTLAALLLSALVSLLYTGYTRTGIYRRSEVERIVERERVEGGDMNFSKPEDK